MFSRKRSLAPSDHFGVLDPSIAGPAELIAWGFLVRSSLEFLGCFVIYQQMSGRMLNEGPVELAMVHLMKNLLPALKEAPTIEPESGITAASG